MNGGPEEIDLNDVQFTPELLRCVPSAVARKYRVLPVINSPEFLCLALDDPSDIEAIDSLTHILRRDLAFAIVKPSQLNSFLERFYGK